MSLSQEDGTLKVARVAMNRKRFINVLFGDVVRPKLATRGRTLTKEELTLGLKRDQRLHELIASEYNNPKRYNSTAHNVGFKADASSFQAITWPRSRDLLSNLVGEYEKVFYNWKKSGNHGSFEDSAKMKGKKNGGFEDFAKTNRSLIYFHCYVATFPNVLENVTGELPFGLVESCAEKKGRKGLSKDAKEAKKKRDSLAAQRKKSLALFGQTQEARTHAIQISHAICQENALKERLSRDRNRKRELLREISPVRKIAKERVLEYAKRREQQGGNKSINNYSDCDNDSILEEMLELDTAIKETKAEVMATNNQFRLVKF